MKIGIIGIGYVGGTTYEVLKDYYDMIAYDKYIDKFKDNFSKLAECEVIFIAVPTPMSSSGRVDLSIIEEVLNSLNHLNFKKKPIIVIRSTVSPGTTKRLSEKSNFNFIFNPEFLREKHAISDFKNINRVIIGTDLKSNFQKLKDIYYKLLPNARYVFTDFKTAEMIKYASNTVLATQIIMANELYKVCESLDIKYDDVKEILLLDDRIAKNIDVPGPDGDFGFGGKCLPKDVLSFFKMSKENGYNPVFFEEVLRSNLRFRKNHDWKEIKGATSKNAF